MTASFVFGVSRSVITVLYSEVVLTQIYIVPTMTCIKRRILRSLTSVNLNNSYINCPK